MKTSAAVGGAIGEGTGWDPDRALLRARRIRQIEWATVPLYTFGYLAFVPFLFIAIIRRQWWGWVVFGVYLVASVLLMVVTPNPELAAKVILILAPVATVHALVELRPGSALAASRDIYPASETDRASRVVAWQGAEMVLGRDAHGSLLFTNDPDVSPRHVILRRGEQGDCFAEDLGSAAGTFVNGMRIQGTAKLYSGDELRLGICRLRVQADALSVVTPKMDIVPRQADAPSTRGLLRIDHAELRLQLPGIGATGGTAQPGWLVLTDTGEVRFYKAPPEDVTQPPQGWARSPAEFVRKIGAHQGVWAQFGQTKCYVYLTGEPAPERLAAKVEEQAEQVGDTAASAGDQLRDAGAAFGAASSLGSGVELIAKSLKLIRFARNKKRRAAARSAWYPVLLGRQPWPLINARPMLVLEIPWLTEHRAAAGRTLTSTAGEGPERHDAEQHAADEAASEVTWIERQILRAADRLAAAVGAQLRDEAAVRPSDPDALRVRWVAAETTLGDDWDVLVELAGSGDDPQATSWATGPDELAAADGDLATVLAKVPTNRLVVLGEAGAGKTTLAVRLVLDLLAGRSSGDLVPVLVPLTSWNPTRRDLTSWLAGYLADVHPALGGKAGTGEADEIATLLSVGLIVPILDGLDEIPEQARVAAVTQINESLPPDAILVLTSRTEPFRKAVRPPDGPGATVRGAAVIQLCPLDVVEVSRYLRDDRAGVDGSSRWDPVLEAFGTQAPAGQVLTTPLMASLARTIYNSRPGERAAQLRDPAELCRFDDLAAVEAHLIDAFIPAAYRPGLTSRRKTQQAQKWLIFLAGHLETTIGSPDLAWWQLMKAGPAAKLRLVAALAFSVAATAVAGLVTWRAAGPTAGLVAILLFGGAGAARSACVGARGKNSTPSQAVGPKSGAAHEAETLTILTTAFVVGFALTNWIGLPAGVLIGLVIGLVLSFVVLPRVSPSRDLTAPATPRRVLARDRLAALDSAVMAAFLLFLIPGIITGAVLMAKIGPVPALVFGFAFPLYFGVYSSLTSAWLSYALVRVWLAVHRRLPWRLMAFLDDAQARGILRQTGLVYQFRHIEIQHRIATRSVPPANQDSTYVVAAPRRGVSRDNSSDPHQRQRG
jgi:hypothetical protein